MRVETAARLFRERGYDAVGVAELMAAAGFTHGGFYKLPLQGRPDGRSVRERALTDRGTDRRPGSRRVRRELRLPGASRRARRRLHHRGPQRRCRTSAGGHQNRVRSRDREPADGPSGPKRHAGGCGPTRGPHHGDRHARPFGRSDHAVAGMPGRFSAGGRNP
ncbi:helix-turn-helix domain-containing protein [Streptomyces sp. NPDC013157]|uniref:helix-turn-helix domain-containing protein n=1 Tax=Streptomyces sp. NPDC013157 TaxID=3364861 RepID=UPI003689A9AA